ncbi:cobalamin (vitamin B12) biosynthesis CbiM protein [Arcobacter nitrofigilis DSM 7299]|uniref:Cobalamin (Vitamin B12) biosynthesis CbiM protein n=1 Tax=Arcobacter nitrofigilis (strain ATCC 33309 / DSM 7299 / CCUG 15893 / LMG 7604 / NCTC 12251 / CI) TaxID=572480 RepID=D5V6J0_ARCNC|nr:cobalt transporter CbiM [Arcobacter nitrofigilis]ADG94260.1 cobalamin (vitamin B12) biosynthesis CbiM protein [Arcobacter nitrofigilis DSM 7299]
MHIADGVLTLESTAVVSAISLVCLYISIKSIKDEKITLAAAMSAMFFIATFIHVPLGVTQIHLVLIGVIGILIGWMSFISIFIALVLQALLLGYGGVVSLGVNLFVMGMPAIIVYYLYNMDITNRLNEKVKFFLVGFLGTFFATLFLAIILLFSKPEYEYASYTIFIVDSGAMIIEGIISMFLLQFIKKTYPKILKAKS